MKCIWFPNECSVNKYLDLLKSGIKKHIEIKTLDFSLNPKFYMKNKDAKVIHLHWPTPYKRNSNFLGSFISNLKFICVLVLSKFLGFKIIWTVHNVLPHTHGGFDKIVRFLMYHLCDCVVVQSISVKKNVSKKFGKHRHIEFIPHGNYVDVYKFKKGLDLRKRFKIMGDDFVFLFFGSIEKYKGLLDLIEVFEKLDVKNTKLLIVGKIYDSHLKKELSSIKNKNIILVTKFIADHEVKDYFNLCDVVVLPFRKVTTSGSLVLAMSMGRPTIIPDFPNLKEYGGGCSLYFKPGNLEDLKETMIRAKEIGRERRSQIGDCAIKRVRKWDWGDIGRRYGDLYNKLISE